MKKQSINILPAWLTIFSLVCSYEANANFIQPVTPNDSLDFIPRITSKSPKPKKINKMIIQDTRNSRISFIFGAGAGVIPMTIYQEPAVDKSSNLVKLSKSDGFKTGLSLGIVYTPKLWNLTNGNQEETLAKGISYALFLNPSTIGTLGNNLTKSNVDVGFGIGHRTVGGFSAFFLVDFFSIRQPKNFFIEEYKNGDKSYNISNQIQTSIDINDNGIFYDRLALSIGFKFCYTFDIIKSYQKSSNDNE